MNIRIILALSLMLNLVLAGISLNRHGQGHRFARGSLPGRTSPNSDAKATSGEGLRITAARATLVVVTNREPVQFDWRTVESKDYRQYIANLRALGCPEQTIRDIIRADVDALFAPRRAALRTSTNQCEYWKPGNPLTRALDQAQVKQARELAREKQELLALLLGTAPEEKPELYAGINPYEKVLDFLPDAKLAETVKLIEEYQMKRMKALPAGLRTPQDYETYRQLKMEEEAALARILTPPELEDYLLRMSNTAHRLRGQLTGFEVTEPEFREMFKVLRKFDDVFGRQFNTPAERARHAAAEREQETQFRRILGDQRYQEYCASQQKQVHR